MTFDQFRDKELEGWDERAEGYEGATARVTTQAIPALLSAIRARVGLRVLDVCTGPGFAAGAADAIGAVAEGVDFAPSMVAAAKARFPRLEFRIGDALALDEGDASYDAVICNFGVFHFTEPAVAFAEAFRVLRPGGRYAFSQWCAPAESALFARVFGAIRNHADMSRVPPSPDAFVYSDPQSCKRDLEAIGFRDIEIARVESTYYGQADKFWGEFMQFSVRTPIIMNQQSEANAAAIEGEITASVAEFDSAGALAIPMPSLVVSGVKGR